MDDFQFAVPPTMFCVYASEIMRKERKSENFGTGGFERFFGTTPRACAVMWQRVGSSKQSDPRHLLYAHVFLKTYGTDHHHASICNVDEKTFRKWSWHYVEKLANMRTIDWAQRMKCKPVDGIRVSVDGTDFSVFEPTVFDPSYYSHKIKRAGLRYEVGVSFNGDIVWVNGPFPAGSNNDVSIFRLDLKHALLPGERIITDGGYGDERCASPNKITVEGRGLASEIRARHETVNACFKKFNVLRVMFRHERSKHSYCFHAVANITQLMMDTDPLFFLQY
eukprot:IDg5219t1